MIGRAIGVLAVMGATLAGATAADRIALPLFAVSLVLPQGWTGTVPAAKPIPTAEKDHDFQVQIEASCTAAPCRQSQDVCTIKTYDEIIGLWDTVSNAMLFPTANSRAETTKRVLAWTSDDATVAKPLGRETFGPNAWMTIETTAAPGYKSVLHARAVLDGRFLGALCRTCAIGPSRFEGARALLASIRVADAR